MSRAWRLIPRFHPQIRARDVLLAWFRRAGRRVSFQPPGGSEILEGDRMVCLSSASGGLAIALRALRLPDRSAVGVPVYTCGTVFEAVRQANLQCAFIDIDPQTFRYDPDHLKRQRDNLKAVILVHTFGYDGDFDRVADVVGNVPILEDCAHATGSTDSRGLPLGLRGAASVFSFNFHKPVSAGGGGLLVVNDQSLAPHVKEQCLALPDAKPPSFTSMLRTAMKAGAYRSPWYGLILKAGQEKARKDNVFGDVHVGLMNPVQRSLVERGLSVMPQRMPLQRSWAARYSREVGWLDPVRQFESIGERWNGYLWPVLLNSVDEKDRSMELFRRFEINAFALYGQCLRVAAEYGYVSGSCPQLEESLQRLLMLPCYAELTGAQGKRILNAITHWKREVLSPPP